jgi:hypothetical protein
LSVRLPGRNIFVGCGIFMEIVIFPGFQGLLAIFLEVSYE